MNNPNLELSNGGIKVSYNRYFSDLAVGVLFTFYLFVLQHNDKQFYKINFLEITNIDTVSGIIYSVLIIALIPVWGILFNAISWMLLGWIQKNPSNRIINNNSFLFKSLLRDNLSFLWINKFKPDKNRNNDNDWYNFYCGLKIIISDKFNSLNIRYNYLEGLKKFLRNINVLILVIFINTWIIEGFSLFHLIYTIIFLIIFLLLTIYVSVYTIIKTLAASYVIINTKSNIVDKNKLSLKEILNLKNYE